MKDGCLRDCDCRCLIKFLTNVFNQDFLKRLEDLFVLNVSLEKTGGEMMILFQVGLDQKVFSERVAWKKIILSMNV